MLGIDDTLLRGGKFLSQMVHPEMDDPAVIALEKKENDLIREIDNLQAELCRNRRIRI